MADKKFDVCDFPLDVLSVGDTVIDDFIRLGDDTASSQDLGDGQSTLTVPFGQKIPFEDSTVLYGVGNAANASVNFAKLGLKSGLVTHLGNDERGREVLRTLHDKDVETCFVKLQPGKQTNYHYVLWYKEDRTILINHEHYSYQWPKLHGFEVPKWIYFSSVAQNAVEYHDQIAEWLKQNPSVKLAFQPGTFQIMLGAERLKELYEHTEVVALNREEAVQVTGGDYNDVPGLIDKMHALGPKIVLLTDGPSGSYVGANGAKYFMPIYPDPAPPKERTGCGDSYTSTFVAALMKGYPVEGAMQLAPITPTNVVQHIGAQEGLLTESELKEWLEKAPANYKPERIA